jgi:hypothetical protein
MMTTTHERIDTPVLPERLQGQGLDPEQYESGDRAIVELLTDAKAGPETDLVITYRDGAYEVWAKRGMIRFQRFYAPDGHGFDYRVIEQIGENPVANQDRTALATIDDELAACKASGFPADDPNRAFIAPEHTTYPYAYERIAQLFDSPNAPDIVVNPRPYAFGRQPGQHGALDVIHARSPLVFSGPGVKRGVVTSAPSRQIDIAPTIAKLLGFPLIDGKDITGRTSSERGVAPDVYLKRQDGRVLDEILDAASGEPKRVYIILLDGQSNTELKFRLRDDEGAIPNLRRLIDCGVMFEYGSMTNFPSITWPSHNSIGTGAWCGHHDIVNPTYYLRETRETVTPQGQQFDTARFLGDGVETLYEACHRDFGAWQGTQGAFTASIHVPCTRGADHATLERVVIGDRGRLRELTARYDSDTSDRWLADKQEGAHRESIVDGRGVAQAVLLYTNETHPAPMFMFHEFTLTDGVGHDYGPHSEGQRTALDETDARVGHILTALDDAGMFEDTLFIITTDHGMAPVDAELKANQVRAVRDAGMRAIIPDPLIYLIDMAIDIQAHEDGRTAMIEVLANDPDTSGERPPVAGAEVTLSTHNAKVLARAKTDAGGTCGIPLPLDVAPQDMFITVHHDEYNARHLRLDGTPVREDIRKLLYG